VKLDKLSQGYEIPDEKLSYSELKDRIREEITGALPKKERIVLLAKKLEDDLTIKDTICSQICTDFKDLISPDYIRKCLPEEYKQKSKMRRGACNTNIANDNKNVAEQRIVAIDASSTGQGTISEIESDLKQEIIKLRRLIEEKDKQLEEKDKQLEEKDKQLEEKDKQLEEKDKQIAALQASQKVKDIPQSVEDKIGPTEVQNLREYDRRVYDDRRGLQAFAFRSAELIRRRIKEVGHASIKFCAINKYMDLEYLVPVVFTIDMRDRTIEMEYDESRLDGLMYV
jgi:chromosome segregation ATPase